MMKMRTDNTRGEERGGGDDARGERVGGDGVEARGRGGSRRGRIST